MAINFTSVEKVVYTFSYTKISLNITKIKIEIGWLSVHVDQLLLGNR